MASWGQHKLLNGVLIPQFCEKRGISPTKENVHEVKEMFKRYLKIPMTRLLDEKQMTIVVQAFVMLCAREYGIMLSMPEEQGYDVDEMSMSDFLALHRFND